MENIDVLDLKIDSLIEVSRSALDVNREMLSEIKKQGDIMAVQLSHQSKEIEELKDGLRDASNARKEIYTRLEKQERRCAAHHGEYRAALTTGEKDFDANALKWFHSQAGKALLWGASIIIAVILTRLAGRVL